MKRKSAQKTRHANTAQNSMNSVRMNDDARSVLFCVITHQLLFLIINTNLFRKKNFSVYMYMLNF